MEHLVKMRLVIKEKGLKMHDLASLFKKAPSTINNYLNGKNDMPLEFFIEFCDYFKIPYSYMLSNKQEYQLMKINLDNSHRVNELMREILELKSTIISLQENRYTKVSSKAI
jgi:transcriptional regulator with XRE-family HTH domain